MVVSFVCSRERSLGFGLRKVRGLACAHVFSHNLLTHMTWGRVGWGGGPTSYLCYFVCLEVRV